MITTVLFLAGFCYDPNIATTHTAILTNPSVWQVKDSCADWQGVISNPSLTCVANTPTYYRSVIRSAIDAATQNWTRYVFGGELVLAASLRRWSPPWT
jgi:hypothetical protein